MAVIRLRTATKKDFEFLRKVRNTASSVSTFKHYIKRKEHLEWCSRAGDIGIKIYVVLLGHKRIGYLKINTHHHNEISIALLKEYRHGGYGSQALDLLPAGTYIANINVRNERSIQFFKKNGFTEIDNCIIMRRSIKR